MLPRRPAAVGEKALGVYFEVHGEGYPLMLGFPITASPSSLDPRGTLLKDYLVRLTDRYRVLVMDYPDLGLRVGRSECIGARQLTTERVCADLLRVAAAAGFNRFAWWGFSWGAVIGLQLASRSNRVKALICGGWPPLGGPYTQILRGARAVASKLPPDLRLPPEQFVTFYESIQGWPESKRVQRIRCPKLTYIGSCDSVDVGGITLPLAATTRARRPDLERQGWSVVEFLGRDHSIYTDPAAVVPVVKDFLDRATGAHEEDV